MATVTASKARKLAGEIYPEREYIDKGLSEGWATVERPAMRHIIIDHNYQARVIPLDMAHVKLLADTRTAQIDSGQGDSLFPVVTFLTHDGKYVLADGFHRHEENRRREKPDLLAYVIRAEDWEHEARLYSAMCNRLAMKSRKKEDIRKAAEILFADPLCWTWTDLRISNHCGCSQVSVTKWRTEYAKQTGLCLPQYVLRSDGVRIRYGHDGIPNINRYEPKGKKAYYWASIGGRAVRLGHTIEDAEAKLKEIYSEQSRENIQNLTLAAIQSFLLHRRIEFESIHHLYKDMTNTHGIKIGNAVITTAKLDDPESVPWAIGCLRMLRILTDIPAPRMICVCYPKYGPASSIEIARRDGIEFLTPDELVASLKGDQAAPDTGGAS